MDTFCFASYDQHLANPNAASSASTNDENEIGLVHSPRATLATLARRLGCKRYGLYLGLATQIVHARLETLAPSVKVETSQDVHSGLLEKDIKRLALAHKGSAISRHVHQNLLFDFPHGLVYLLEISWDRFNLLHGSLGVNEGATHLVIPQVSLDQIAH